MASDRRLHPVSFVFAIGQTARRLLFPLIGGIFVTGGRWSWEALLAVAVLPTAGLALLQALSVRYRLDDDELVVRSGMFVKRVTHIPYDRVQNINAVQTVFHQMLRVIEVRIETGGGNEAEATLRVIDESALAELRESVFGDGTPEAAATPAETSGSVLLRLSGRELILLGLLRGRGMLIAAGLYGFLWDSGLFGPAQRAIFGSAGPPSIFREVERAIEGDASLTLSQVAILAAGLVAVLLVFRLCSAGWTALKFHGFMLTLDNGDLRVEYGLLTHVKRGVALRRIQKVTVHRGLWHRISGYASVDVQTAAGQAGFDAQPQHVWVAPLINAKDVGALLQHIVPAAAQPAWQPVDPRGTRREFFAALRLVVPTAAALLWAFGPWALTVVSAMLALAWVRAVRYVAALRWSTAGEFVQFESGWVSRRKSFVPIRKVQAVSQLETPLDRRHRMRSVEIDVAGGVTSHRLRIPYLATVTAASVSNDVARRSEGISFRGAPLDRDPRTASGDGCRTEPAAPLHPRPRPTTRQG